MTKIPPDCRLDAKGRYVPLAAIPEVDLLRDQLVTDLLAQAQSLQGTLQDFKDDVFGKLEDFLQEAARLGKVKVRGEKGNFTLFSFDGSCKITVQTQARMGFNESLQLAKDQLLRCVNRWAEGANAHLLALVNQAFELDQEGNVNIHRILQLRRTRIEDREWKKGIDLLTQSMQTVDSKRYLRFYVRDAHGAYQSVSLDLAAL